LALQTKTVESGGPFALVNVGSELAPDNLPVIPNLIQDPEKGLPPGFPIRQKPDFQSGSGMTMQGRGNLAATEYYFAAFREL